MYFNYIKFYKNYIIYIIKVFPSCWVDLSKSYLGSASNCTHRYQPLENTLFFSSRSKHYSLKNKQKCPKNNGQWGLFRAKTHPLSKFNGNQFSNFCVILLTKQPTIKQSNIHLWNVKEWKNKEEVEPQNHTEV